jgi:hypothetical protein
MYHFCTYFDSNFLATGLTLYRSLEEQCPQFKLWVLCLDDKCFEVLSSGNFPNLLAVPLSDLESADIPLAESRANRSLIEYYFTCTASFTLFLLDRNPEIKLITYLDADLYFFADPAPIYGELLGHSVGIIGHRFPEAMKKLERYGIYNVGWVSFRRDQSGMACLESWREQCIEWCYDRLESGRFADQKYLDVWPVRFSGVKVIRHSGANLAPWNVAGFKLSISRNMVWVDNEKLLFFHFHGLKKVNGLPLYNTSLGDNRAILNSILRKKVYHRYLATRQSVGRELLKCGYAVTPPRTVRNFVSGVWSNRLLRSMSKLTLVLYSVLVCRAYLIFR